MNKWLIRRARGAKGRSRREGRTFTIANVMTNPILTRTIPSTGEPIPAIGLGTWQTFLVDVETHLKTLRRWKQDGRIRYIGVTHYRADAQDAVADLIATEPVDFVQINYSASEREAEKRLLPLAMDRGIAVIANRPLAAGNLARQLSAQPLPAWAKEIACENWPQILLKFVIAHPAIACAIPGTSKPAHLHDNMKAASGPLPGEKLRALIAAAVHGSGI